MPRVRWLRSAKSRRLASGLLGICLAGILAGIAGCAGVPEVDPASVAQPGVPSSPQIMGSRGPLTPSQSKGLLQRIATEAGDAGMLDRHLAIEQAVAETPLVIGNRTRILRDGEETFAAVFTAIRGAKRHINLEYYILEDIEHGGEPLSDLLIAKRQQQVAVNVIYDSYGSIDTPAEFFERLRQADVKLLEYNPINPLKAKVEYSLNERNHRKILVVDGATAIVGGVNLSTTYQAGPLSKSPPSEETPVEHWRDTAMQIDGPVVSQVQTLFVQHWASQNGEELATEGFFPTVPPSGKEIVRIIGSTPDHTLPRYYVTLLSAIRNAEKSVKLTAAYFVPTEQAREDLVAAARRGVDVTLLLPDRSDSKLALSVGRSHYAELLEAGVTIYESQGVVLHSKTVVIDGVWSVIGSSNADPRSVIFNDEVDAVVLGSDTAAAMERMFDDDISRAKRIDPVEWAQRPILQRTWEFLSRVWRNLL